mmetsp:Transcript_84191/g.234795  ORF Transcript_84191/g.234795 Transcript_84191/m.234795 type:complete len:389 (+) Transcript_84191:84-1250(+)
MGIERAMNKAEAKIACLGKDSGGDGRPLPDGRDEAANGCVSDSNTGEDEAGECGEQDEGEDGHPADKSNDENVEWEEAVVCPLTVRFTQEKIHPFFYRRGPIVNVVPLIRVVMPPSSDDAENDDEACELIPPFDAIRCLRKGDELWSLDNRRLYALQLAAMEVWPSRCHVRVLYTNRLPRRQLKTHWRKMQTTKEGRSICVCARYQQFDTWSWFSHAVDLELSTFSYRLGLLLNIFQILPVVGTLLFRTGILGLSSRLPFVIGLVMAFAMDFFRQKVPIFERRICELHVKAIMDGSVRMYSHRGRRHEAGESSMSGPQVVACVATVLILVLPYVHSIPHQKLRSSVFSWWFGVACVLVVQAAVLVKTKRSAEIEYSGTSNRYSPKHSS